MQTRDTNSENVYERVSLSTSLYPADRHNERATIKAEAKHFVARSMAGRGMSIEGQMQSETRQEKEASYQSRVVPINRDERILLN